jgi:hypothetical protein
MQVLAQLTVLIIVTLCDLKCTIQCVANDATKPKIYSTLCTLASQEDEEIKSV